MGRKLHDYWISIFKGDGDDLREDHSLILEKMSIKNVGAEPSEIQKEAVLCCLDLVTKGEGVDNAAIIALSKAAERKKTEIVKSEGGELSSRIEENVNFDKGIDDFLSAKADELTNVYDPKEALAHILEGMIERGEDLNGGMSAEEVKGYYRMIGKQKIDNRLSERTEQSIPLSEAEAIFNDVVSRRVQRGG